MKFSYYPGCTLKTKAKELDKAGLQFSSVWYTPDLRFNPMRFICVVEQLRRQNKKFKIYYPKYYTVERAEIQAQSAIFLQN